MSTRRIVLSLLAAVLALAGCGPRAESLRPLRAPTPAEGVVVYVSGGVQISSGDTWTDAEPGDTVAAGATIRTGKDGSCELRFGDTVSVLVEPDTRFRCDNVAIDTSASVSGELPVGAILAKVKRLAGSDLQVRTPSAVAGVRGTEFMVKVSGSATTVTVREGTVSVTQEAQTVDVEAGQRAEAAPGTAIVGQPAAAEDLAAIDAFVPSTVDTGDVRKLVQVLVVVDPPDAEIWIGTRMVGVGTWGAVLEEGADLTLQIQRAGYNDEQVFVPREKGRITRKLNPLPATPESSTEPVTEAAAAPAASVAAPVQPSPEAIAPATAEETPQPAASPAPAAVQEATFRVDPAIGNDPFLREMAARFARLVPGFSLVTGPASPNLDAGAWPRGADLVGGMDNATQFTYERLPQLVAAKLVRPLDGWFEWTQLSPVLVDAVRVGGRIYGVPIGGSSLILYYNRAFVSEAPRAWSDISALAAEYAQKGGDALVVSSLEPYFMGMFPESRGIQLLVTDTAKSGLGSARAAIAYDAMRQALLDSAMLVSLQQNDAVALFCDGGAAMLIDGPWSFDTLRKALGDSLGMAVLPSWGSPAVQLTPYANVLSLFVSTGVSEDRATVLKRFVRFLLEPENQLELCKMRLKTGTPIAPAIRLAGGAVAKQVESEAIISVLYHQLENAVPMPRGPLAPDAWKVFTEVLDGIRRKEGGEQLQQMADARFLLYGLERRPMPAGARELRAIIDPASDSQGLFFRPVDAESDLRIISPGDGRGVVSVNDRGPLADRGRLSYVYLVLNHDPYRGGKAPALKGRITYFDEANATLRIVYDSKDASVRVDPNAPDTWGAWKEAAFIASTGTQEWKTVEFPIPDARFDRRCNGADLRVEVVARGKIPAIRSVILSPAK